MIILSEKILATVCNFFFVYKYKNFLSLPSSSGVCVFCKLVLTFSLCRLYFSLLLKELQRTKAITALCPRPGKNSCVSTACLLAKINCVFPGLLFLRRLSMLSNPTKCWVGGMVRNDCSFCWVLHCVSGKLMHQVNSG